MRTYRRIMVKILIILILAAAMPLSAFALINTYDNEFLIIDATPSGKVGKTMTINMTLHNASGIDQRLGVGVDTNVYFDDEDAVQDARVSRTFPFEVNKDTFEPVFTKSDIDAGKERRVSLNIRVRKDLQEGYYTVGMAIYSYNSEGKGSEIAYEYINIWVEADTDTTDDEKDDTTDFILGEGQNTPAGIYPNVMNYSVNLRNNSHATVYDVKVSMVLDADDTVFPFEINDVNYDRMFEKIEVDQVVELPYSMAIRPDTYTNYYQIKLKISYSPNSNGGDRKEYETAYFVNITNKDEEDDKGDFNENDRTMARIIVDSFETVPKDIIAGEEFELICRVRNASQSIGATNLLFTMESEKVSESAIFTSESGSSAIAVNSLAPDQIYEIRMRLVSKPGAEQRSYAMKINTKFDSPEYKNAAEVLTLDIPVKQIPRLNTSSFEIMPSSIAVGEEANVMFGINNTGKVMLYNVMVQFEADSIQPLENYVGNIEPGKTGNVDSMLIGTAATGDDGMVKVVVSYEDENGAVSTIEEELQLYVSEEMPLPDDIIVGNFDDSLLEEESFFSKYKGWISGGAGAAVVLLAAAVILIRRRRRKKRLALEEEMDDEIS